MCRWLAGCAEGGTVSPKSFTVPCCNNHRCCCGGCCRADTAAKGDERTAKLSAVITAADDVIAAINATELAAFLAMRAPADDADGGSSGSNDGSGGSNGGSSAAQSYKETKGEKEKEKAALLEALRVKLKAQLDLAEVW